MRRLILALLFALSGFAALAVQPDEMMQDPALEARARALSRDLRCLVCQNQSIDDSDAPLARDLRLLLRQRLKAGDSDQAATQFLVERYGDYVLLRPPFKTSTLLLWLGPLLLLLGGVVAAVSLYRKRPVRDFRPLSDEERSRLAPFLADGDGK